MKIVYHNPEKIYSENISEVDLDKLIQLGLWRKVDTKSPYELLRLRHSESSELVIIYQDNRKFRSKNEWIEKRAIVSYLKQKDLSSSVKLNVQFVFGEYRSEIDGIMENIGFEIKFKIIGNEELKLFEKKRQLLELDQMIVITKGYKSEIKSQQWTNFDLYTFIPDWKGLISYYQYKMEIPTKISYLFHKRHVRYLLSNGSWRSQKRRYTSTAKRSALDKFKLDLKILYKSKNKPVKIYWSLSSLLSPIDEFRGKGWPLNSILASFDIDGSHENEHEIDCYGVCKKCMNSSKFKLNKTEEKLKKLDYDYEIFFSGSKGFHIYLMENGVYLTKTSEEMKELTRELQPYVDPFLAKNTGRFDDHRIFKIPYSVDASTGIIVSPKYETLEFNDQLIKFI